MGQSVRFLHFTSMDFVYPYNVHDTTYYYYDPMVEMVDSMGMMSISPGSYIPDQNNNLSPHHHGDHHQEYQEYYAEDADTLHYQKINSDYIINDAFIIVDPSDFPFIDLPYLQDGKQSFHGKKQKFKKGQKGFAPQRMYKEEEEECDEGSVELVQPEISYDRDELMNISKLPLSQATPDSWSSIAKKLPRLVRREGPTANLLIKEVRAIKKQEELNVAKHGKNGRCEDDIQLKKTDEPQILSL